MNDLLKPQPAPKDTGSRPIWPLVVQYVEGRMAGVDRLAAYTALLVGDMRARDEQGRAKYGVPLTAGDGRDHLVDAYQEALDMCVYLRADCDCVGLTPEERLCSWRLFERAVEMANGLRIRIAIRRGEVRPHRGSVSAYMGPVLRREADVNDLLKPQPAPKDTGSRPIWPLVVQYVEGRMAGVDGLAAYTALLVSDMRARDEQGRAKYGVPLTAGDGRDHLVDAYQEALDMAVYLRADCDCVGLTPEERLCSWRLFERAVEMANGLRIRLAIRRGEVRR